MTATPASAPIAILIAGVVLLHLGAFLIKWAWFPRRVGKTPHCRNCDYPLTGLESADRCPECGQHLTPRTVVRGERPRRRAMGALALLLTLLGLLTTVAYFTPQFRSANWYQYKPLLWVLSDLESTDGELQSKAWAEIVRRRQAKILTEESDLRRLDETTARVVARPTANNPGEALRYVITRFDRLPPAQQDAVFARLLADLKSNIYLTATTAVTHLRTLEASNSLAPEHHAALAAHALAVQASPRIGIADRDLFDYLARREQAGALTPAQRDAFFTRAFNLKLRARPDCLAADQLPYWIDYNGRGPQSSYWHRIQPISYAVDDDTPVKLSSSSYGSGLGSGASGSSFQAPEALGKHTFRITIETSVYLTEAEMNDRAKPPHWTRQTTLTAPIEVLPKNAPGYITLIDDPAAAQAMARKVKVDDLRLGAQPGWIEVSVSIDKPDYDIAFDVYALHAGKEYRLGGVYAWAGQSHSFGTGTSEFDRTTPPPKTVDIVFRPSPTVAKGTVDLYHIWNGEVRLNNVKLDPPRK